VTGIVTPEAVRLEFEIGGVGTRTLATLIDLLIQLAALFVLAIVMGLFDSAGISEATAVIFGVIGLFLILLGYPILSETLWNGQTVGKAALGLRVRTAEGAPIRFRHAAIRGALGLVDLYLTWGLAAVLSTLLTKNSQRLGDLAAGTLVLRERSAPSRTSTAFAFYPPPGWDDYAASLDVGGVTADQYGLVRNFLLRASEMTPGARYHLALRLANPLAGVLHHDPPPGVAPETFLHCLAAAYQHRQSTFAAPPPGPVPS
jgi:uncharacterized RDD family membrane protein YckC